MLSQDDRQRLAEIERRLMDDDPGFVARMRSEGPLPWSFARLLHRPKPTTLVLAGLWAAAFAMTVLARSTILAVVLLTILVIEAAWRVYRHRHPVGG